MVGDASGCRDLEMDERHGATTVNAKIYRLRAANNIEAVLFEGWNEG